VENQKFGGDGQQGGRLQQPSPSCGAASLQSVSAFVLVLVAALLFASTKWIGSL
jgi:hypothetical protein